MKASIGERGFGKNSSLCNYLSCMLFLRGPSVSGEGASGTSLLEQVPLPDWLVSRTKFSAIDKYIRGRMFVRCL